MLKPPATGPVLIVLLLLQEFIWAQQPRLVLPVSHVKKIEPSFNGSGELLLTHSEDKSLVWSVKYGKLLYDLDIPLSKIHAITFNSEGNKLIAITDNNGICVMDARNGIQERQVKLNSSITTGTIDLKNSRIITAHTDSSVVIWDVRTLKSTSVIRLSFIPDETRSYNGSSITVSGKNYDPNDPDNPVITKRVNLINNQVENPPPFKPAMEFMSSAGFSVLLEKGDALFKNKKTGKILQQLGYNSTFNNIAFSGKHNTAAFYNEGYITAWNVNTGAILKRKIAVDQIDKIGFVDGHLKLWVYSYNDTCYLYDITRGSIDQRFRSKQGLHHAQAFNSKQSRIALISGQEIQLIDTKQWRTLFSLKGNANRVEHIDYSSPRNSLISSDLLKNVKQWDLGKATIDLSIRDSSWCANLTAIHYCHDNIHFWIDACEGIASLWDAGKGVQVKDSFECRNVSTAAIEGTLYVRIQPESMGVYQRNNDSLQFSFDTPVAGVVSATMSPDEKSLLSIDKNNNIMLWDITSRSWVKDLYENPLKYNYTATRTFSRIVFNGPGTYYFIESADNYLNLWDAKEHREAGKFPGRSGIFINDSVLAGIDHSMIVFYNVNKKEEMFKMFSTGNGPEYMYVLPSKYYTGSTQAAKSIHYIRDQRIISFEQLDIRYNRPDMVLKHLGSQDTALIRSYRRAWEKRVMKMGIDTASFRDDTSVPEADFANRDRIAFEQKTGSLRLHITGMDSVFNLDRFNVWVNESPVFGQKGISIRRKNNNRIDTTLTVTLSQGENRIETSITNVNGTESYRMPLFVNYTPAVKQKESLRFIGIGIDRFEDAKNNLQYSTKDIRDLSLKLKEKYRDNITIDTLFNEQVTTENVKALKKKLQRTAVNDKVILSYSGHGVLNKDYDYYLSTYSMNFDQPEQGGLPYEELENLLDSIPARKKLMLIDACHSGEVDKEEMARLESANVSLQHMGTKGGGVTYTGKPQVGMKNSFELMQSLFVNVGKSTGATIISAAAGTQFALERGDLKNGVFTYSILEAMSKNPAMKISELKKIVGERVEQLTNGLQKPTSRNETIAVDWAIW